MKILFILYSIFILSCSARAEEIVLRSTDPSQIVEFILTSRGMMLEITCNKYPYEQSNGNLMAVKVLKWEVAENGFKYIDQTGRQRIIRRAKIGDKLVYLDGESLLRKVDESILYKKLNDLRRGMFPKLEDELKAEWSPFTLEEFEKLGGKTSEQK